MRRGLWAQRRRLRRALAVERNAAIGLDRSGCWDLGLV